MRIAFYGGSFDPPHLGHLRIAQAAADRMRLDRVLLAPVALQPLKRSGPPPASYVDRLAMLRLLLEADGDPRLVLSELDAPRPDSAPNYTYETLARLRETLAPENHIFVLTGADALLTLPHWHRVVDLVASVDFIVAARPGFPLDRLMEPLLSLVVPSVLERGALEAPGVTHLVLLPGEDRHRPPGANPRDGTQAQASVGTRADFYYLPDLDEDVSSTSIREALAEDPEAAAADLSPAVSAYIRAHALYRRPRPQATMGR